MAGQATYQDEETGSGMISDINVTPLVDITLVLLIIFMVTAQLIVERGISIESPKTASGAEVKGTLAVTIDKQLVLYVNGETYSDPAAARRVIEDAVMKKPDVKAIISADKSVPHGEVMKAIDMVKLAGVTKFALASDPLPPEEEQ